MLACIPTEGNSGINDTICAHFGSAPFFTLVNTATDEITVLPNNNAHHSHGTCHPMQTLAAHPIECIICTGMGRRAVEKMMAQGIRLYRAPSTAVSDAVQGLKANQLQEMDLRQACAGHGQHH